MHKSHLKRVVYSICVFVLFVGVGEGFARAVGVEDILPNTKLRVYTPAYEQMDRFEAYVRDNGVPQCVFLGNSYTQVGIDPYLFEQAFMVQTGTRIDCYNFGMDGATLSSIQQIQEFLYAQYHPEVFILGISASQFLPAGMNRETENIFSLEPRNLHQWLSVNSSLYRTVFISALEMFPEANHLPVVESTSIYPEVPRTINTLGFGPLLGYRDGSPLFHGETQSNSQETIDLDHDDLIAFQQLLEDSLANGFKLLVVQMPFPAYSSIESNTIHSISDLARKSTVPVLSRANLTVMPPTAFSNRHLHIYGSQMFSAWLGSQIGKAFAADAFDKVDDPVWFPEVKEWAPPTALATLGLKDTSYQAYQAFLEQFKLVPFDVVIYLPSDERFTRNFLQTLLGFESDWRKDMTDEERHKRYELMSLLEQARYLSELPAVQMQGDQLAQWQKNLDSTLLVPLNVRYVLCRRDRANPDVEYCPKGLADSPQYKLVGTWNLDPLYETYTLYQIESARANR